MPRLAPAVGHIGAPARVSLVNAREREEETEMIDAAELRAAADQAVWATTCDALIAADHSSPLPVEAASHG